MAFFDSYRVILTHTRLTRILFHRLVSIQRLVIVLTVLVGYSGTASALDDAYLKELEAEANKTSNFKSNAHSPNNNTASSNTASKTSVKNNAKTTEVKQQIKKPSQSQTKNVSIQDQLKSFEQLLKFERPSTYRFYKRLDLNEKKLVLKDYNESKKISTASKLIFDLYFKH